MARIDDQAYAVLHVSDSESALVITADTVVERVFGAGDCYLAVPGHDAGVAIVAVTYVHGTCGLNDLSSETRLPAGVAWPFLATARVVWHATTTDSRVHSCELCASARVSFYDTGVRLPTVERYSAAV